MLEKLPDGLPKPIDDGACNRLKGKFMPNVELRSTDGQWLNISTMKIPSVFFCYPMTGVPGKSLPDDWDLIPGARGCTPQACSFRDNYRHFTSRGFAVYGVSTQSPQYQIEAKKRLHLPYDLLSDEHQLFARALKLPLLYVENFMLIKRVTLIVFNRKVQHFFYPIFQPHKHPDDVIKWIDANPLR